MFFASVSDALDGSLRFVSRPMRRRGGERPLFGVEISPRVDGAVKGGAKLTARAAAS
jgi:hypothetical protein